MSGSGLRDVKGYKGTTDSGDTDHPFPSSSDSVSGKGKVESIKDPFLSRRYSYHTDTQPSCLPLPCPFWVKGMRD